MAAPSLAPASCQTNTSTYGSRARPGLSFCLFGCLNFCFVFQQHATCCYPQYRYVPPAAAVAVTFIKKQDRGRAAACRWGRRTPAVPQVAHGHAPALPVPSRRDVTHRGRRAALGRGGREQHLPPAPRHPKSEVRPRPPKARLRARPRRPAQGGRA